MIDLEGYRVEKATQDNLKELIPLFSKAYGKAPALEELKNKYKTKAFGLENCGFICFFGNEAVCFVGAVPCFLERNGQIIRGAQIGDVMTHPKHFRHGLFHKTAAILFDDLKQNGIEIIFGFPNLNSKPGFKKRLGWEFTNDLKVSIFNQLCLPFIRLKSILPFFATILTKYQDLVLSFYAKKPYEYKSLLGRQFFTIKRNENLFNYKLNHRKSYFWNINGKLVWVKYDEMYVYIGDIEDCELPEFQSIIKSIKKRAFWLGIPHLRFNVSGGSKLKKFLDATIDEDPDKDFAVGGLIFKDGVSFDELKFTVADNDNF